MDSKKWALSGAIAALLAAVSLMAGGRSSQASMSEHANPILFDVIYLNEGKDASEAVAYFERVAVIAQKYGLVRLNTYRVTKNMRGIIQQPALINIWRMDSPDAMQKMGADPAYQKLVPTRDALFDMAKVSLLMADSA